MALIKNRDQMGTDKKTPTFVRAYVTVMKEKIYVEGH
jgi:hypothetical protein